MRRACALLMLALSGCASLPHSTRSTEGEPTRITAWPGPEASASERRAFVDAHKIQDWDQGAAKVDGRWMSFADTAAYLRQVSPEDYDRRLRISSFDRDMANGQLWLPLVAAAVAFGAVQTQEGARQDAGLAVQRIGLATLAGGLIGLAGNWMFKQGVARHWRLIPKAFDQRLKEKAGLALP